MQFNGKEVLCLKIKTKKQMEKMNLKQKIDKKEYLKMEIPVELENDYLLNNNLNCNIEETSVSENGITENIQNVYTEKQKYIIDELYENSSIIFYLDFIKQVKMGIEKYLGVIIFTGRFDSTVIELENLAPGLDNFLLWESACIKKYSTGEYASQNYRVDFINVVFEKEVS